MPHTVDAYLDALAPLGIQARCEPALHVDPAAAHGIDAFLDEQGIGPEDTLVGVHPGSKWPLKRWTAEGFAAVAEKLMQRSGTGVVFLGDAEDAQFVDHIRSRLSRRPVVGVGQLDLKGLVAIIDRCAVLLTNDSGPMHVGSALGVPTVAVFGPTHPNLGFAPRGAHSRVVTLNAPCSPCSLHGERPCRLKRRECMEDIPPARVLEALEELINVREGGSNHSAQLA